MTPDEIEKVREHLRLRVGQAIKWANDGFPSTSFAQFSEYICGHLCSIRPFALLNDPLNLRKQSQGVRFVVTWNDSTERIAFVDVLLAPEAKTNERVAKGPWAKVKAVDLSEGQKVNPKKDIIAPWVELNDCDVDQTVDDFFLMWLRRAFERDEKAKILDFVYSKSELE